MGPRSGITGSLESYLTLMITPLADFEFPAKGISSYLRSLADQWHENGGSLGWRSIKQVGTSITHHLARYEPPKLLKMSGKFKI